LHRYTAALSAADRERTQDVPVPVPVPVPVVYPVPVPILVPVSVTAPALERVATAAATTTNADAPTTPHQAPNTFLFDSAQNIHHVDEKNEEVSLDLLTACGG
jgi:hypothetical protein